MFQFYNWLFKCVCYMYMLCTRKLKLHAYTPIYINSNCLIFMESWCLFAAVSNGHGVGGRDRCPRFHQWRVSTRPRAAGTARHRQAGALTGREQVDSLCSCLNSTQLGSLPQDVMLSGQSAQSPVSLTMPTVTMPTPQQPNSSVATPLANAFGDNLFLGSLPGSSLGEPDFKSDLPTLGEWTFPAELVKGLRSVTSRVIVLRSQPGIVAAESAADADDSRAADAGQPSAAASSSSAGARPHSRSHPAASHSRVDAERRATAAQHSHLHGDDEWRRDPAADDIEWPARRVQRRSAAQLRPAFHRCAIYLNIIIHVH